MSTKHWFSEQVLKEELEIEYNYYKDYIVQGETTEE